jgi:hypothetical protein
LRSGAESFARPGGAAVSTCLLDILRGQYPQTDALNDNVGTLHIIVEYIHREGGRQCHVPTRRHMWLGIVAVALCVETFGGAVPDRQGSLLGVTFCTQ